MREKKRLLAGVNLQDSQASALSGGFHCQVVFSRGKVESAHPDIARETDPVAEVGAFALVDFVTGQSVGPGA